MGRLKELEEKFLSTDFQLDFPFEQPDDGTCVTTQINQMESKTRDELERSKLCCTVLLLNLLLFLHVESFIHVWSRSFWELKAERAINAFAQPREQESNHVPTWLDRSVTICHISGKRDTLANNIELQVSFLRFGSIVSAVWNNPRTALEVHSHSLEISFRVFSQKIVSQGIPALW
jgi:hypothetical protein